MTLTRNLIAGAAALASVAALSAPASAYSGHSSPSLLRVPTHPGHFSHPNWHPNWHPHFHRVFIGGRWIVQPVVAEVSPVVVTAPSPCTCLTKEYTPEGIVVFKDLCAKEMASAPVAGSEKTGEVEPSTNFAGKSYQDYLASKSQAQN